MLITHSRDSSAFNLAERTSKRPSDEQVCAQKEMEITISSNPGIYATIDLASIFRQRTRTVGWASPFCLILLPVRSCDSRSQALDPFFRNGHGLPKKVVHAWKGNVDRGRGGLHG